MKKLIKTSSFCLSVVFLAVLFAGEAQCQVQAKPGVVKAQPDEVIAQPAAMKGQRGVAKAPRKLLKAPRSVKIPLDGAKSIRIDTHVGRLVIKAMAGIDVVQASGTASALTKASLDGIRLSASREKDAVLIRAETPGEVPRAKVYVPDPTVLAGRGGQKKQQLPEEPDAFLNLSVTMPANIPLILNTIWGDVSVNGVSSLTLTVNRGNIMIKDLTGDLRLSVDTGEINIIGVAGDVDITKGDGEILINTIGGNVLVRRNPFGEMRVINIKKNVRIVSDGLGDIMVDTVGGDLIVENDLGGDIRREAIQGKVQVPEEGPPKHVREKKQSRKKTKNEKNRPIPK